MPVTVLYLREQSPAAGPPGERGVRPRSAHSGSATPRHCRSCRTPIAPQVDVADDHGFRRHRRRSPARFPRLRAIVRMGVGYDKLDRPAAAARNILVCNVPDYGTTEVADHAIALALTLRRGILLHHEMQRHDPPAPFRSFQHPLIQRLGTQTFGILGLGRIGTAVALRAKAFNFRVVFYDPYLPNGAELALGINRAATLEDLLRQTDTLSIHAPLTPETRGILGKRAAVAAAPKLAPSLSTTRRGNSIIDLDALAELLREGHIAGAGLDVLPQEPPVEPIPELLRAYRSREEWLEGRLVITPHSAWLTPKIP